MSNITQLYSFDPTRRDFSAYGLTCVNWQASLMPRPDHHNEIEINFLTSGSVTYLLGNKKVVVNAGKLSLFWAAIPHQIVDFTDEKPYFVTTIPLHNFLQWRLPEEFVQALMQGNLLCEPDERRAVADVNLFEQWVADLAQPTREITRPVLLEIQARITRLALHYHVEKRVGSTRNHLTGLPEAGLSKVEQMACFIAQHYTQKLTAQQIAEVVNLHPSYAMNLFQKTFGSTLISFITQHRVAHAQRLLTTSDKTVTEIALQSGFSSMSRFNEAFHQISGCSPREYRKAHDGRDDDQQP